MAKIAATCRALPQQALGPGGCPGAVRTMIGVCQR